jgi:hypothetical protein
MVMVLRGDRPLWAGSACSSLQRVIRATKFHYVSSVNVSLPFHRACVVSPLIMPAILYHSSISLQYVLPDTQSEPELLSHVHPGAL